MFERKTLEVLAAQWAYEFSISSRSGIGLHELYLMYERHKDMLKRHNSAFKDSAFDKASEFDRYFNEDGSVK